MFALLTLIPTLALAAPQPIHTVQKLGPGRQLDVQISLPEAGKPSFLFLPGVNRSLLLNEPAAQELIRDGIGVIAFNFSVQPLSLATLRPGEKPAFYEQETSLETLAEEVAGVARAAEKQYGIRGLIPVTLSYTGAVSPGLRGFPLVIDSVPLSSMDAFSPELAMYRNWLKAGELFNPVFGPGITRASLDAAYRMQWTKQVTAMSQQFRLPAERFHEMVDGYIRLSRATEGFEWKNAGDRSRRAFILAAGENPVLLRHQCEVIRERLGRGSRESVFIVQESGHIVPAEQPKVYARILTLLASGRAKPGINLVLPSKDEWKTLGEREGIAFLDKAISELPKTPGGSSSSAPRGDSIPGTLR